MNALLSADTPDLLDTFKQIYPTVIAHFIPKNERNE